jgi:hypothetical protein
VSVFASCSGVLKKVENLRTLLREVKFPNKKERREEKMRETMKYQVTKNNFGDSLETVTNNDEIEIDGQLYKYSKITDNWEIAKEENELEVFDQDHSKRSLPKRDGKIRATEDDMEAIGGMISFRMSLSEMELELFKYDFTPIQYEVLKKKALLTERDELHALIEDHAKTARIVKELTEATIKDMRIIIGGLSVLNANEVELMLSKYTFTKEEYTELETAATELDRGDSEERTRRGHGEILQIFADHERSSIYSNAATATDDDMRRIIGSLPILGASGIELVLINYTFTKEQYAELEETILKVSKGNLLQIITEHDETETNYRNIVNYNCTLEELALNDGQCSRLKKKALRMNRFSLTAEVNTYLLKKKQKQAYLNQKIESCETICYSIRNGYFEQAIEMIGKATLTKEDYFRFIKLSIAGHNVKLIMLLLELVSETDSKGVYTDGHKFIVRDLLCKLIWTVGNDADEVVRCIVKKYSKILNKQKMYEAALRQDCKKLAEALM